MNSAVADRWSHHSVSLAGARLSVGKYTRVVSEESGPNDIGTKVIKYLKKTLVFKKNTIGTMTVAIKIHFFIYFYLAHKCTEDYTVCIYKATTKIIILKNYPVYCEIILTADHFLWCIVWTVFIDRPIGVVVWKLLDPFPTQTLVQWTRKLNAQTKTLQNASIPRNHIEKYNWWFF